MGNNIFYPVNMRIQHRQLLAFYNVILWILNPLHALLFWGNMNIFRYWDGTGYEKASSWRTWMHVSKFHTVLLMNWRRKELWHKKSQYWPSSSEYSGHNTCKFVQVQRITCNITTQHFNVIKRYSYQNGLISTPAPGALLLTVFNNPSMDK